jgi:predicted transport protein
MEIKKIKVDEWDLGGLIDSIRSGRLRIPRFQRDFVWERSKVVKLLSSMYKEFPIGSFFIWYAPKKYNSFFREIPELGLRPPEMTDEIQYILDGQQRITSLYVTIKGLMVNGVDYSKICFDLDKEEFVCLEGDGIRFIPLSEILGEERHKIYDKLSEERKVIFDKCVQVFHRYPLSVVLVYDKGLEDVCEIFERINQGGKRLSIFDLVVAGTWSEDFELKEKIKELNQQLSGSFGEIEPEVVTETLSLILKNQCTRAFQLQLTNTDIKSIWDGAIESIKKSIDFLRNNLGVKKYDFLPYRDLIPLVAYFYYKSSKLSPTQKEKVEEWFWKVSFSERYSTTTFTRMGEDREIFDKLIAEKEVSIDYPININLGKIKNIRMGRSTALRNAIFCILAMKNPKNFRDNSLISLDRDFFSEFHSSEKHHIFPKSFLRKQKIEGENLLVNFCFIPSELNKEILNKKPSDYFKDYKQINENFDEVLNTHLIPYQDNSGIWLDDYEKFISQRAELIESEIKKRVGITTRLEAELESNPGKVVDNLENKVRWKIHSVLYEEFGEIYWQEKIPQDVQVNINDRIKDKLQKQPYENKEEYEQPIKKLEFCDVMDYAKIILKNWNLFEDIFGSKEQLDKHFKNFKEYRNSIKHARQMTNVEKKEGEASIEWIMQSVSKKAESEAEMVDLGDQGEEAHLVKPSGSVTELYNKLKESVLSFGSDVKLLPHKHYIAFKRFTNFTSLKLQKNRIKLWISIDKDKLIDPKRITRDVTGVGHHGTGEYQVIFDSQEDTEYLIGLIKQAYINNKPLTSGEYNLSFHLNKIESTDVKERVEELRKQILAIEDVEEHFTKNHICFNVTYDFVLIYCQRNQFWVDVKLNKEEIKEEGLDIRPHKGEVWTHIRVHSDTDFNALLNVIKQAYEVNEE